MTCGTEWSIEQTPVIPAKNGLSGLAVLSADDVWAVGNRRNMKFRTLTEHRDASGWNVVPSVDVSKGHNSLADVAALSSNNVWAVGFADRGATSTTLIEHWNGIAWSEVTSPNVGTREGNLLTGVAAVSSNDVWAVGLHGPTGHFKTLVEHWDGSAWKVVPSVDVGAGSNVLIGVAATSPSKVWAVGYTSTGTKLRTLVERWDGVSWQAVPSSNPVAGDNVLIGIAALSNQDIWAVGYSRTGSSFATLIERWNGSVWAPVSSPNASTVFNVLRGIVAVSSSEAWSAGAFYDPVADAFQTLVQRWDGATWSVVSTPNAPGDNELSAVASVAGTEVIAVGKSYEQETALALHACP